MTRAGERVEEERGPIRVGMAAAVPRGTAMVATVAARTLAIFNVDGTYYAVDNACAHRGGPLAEGDLEGRVVRCPWHGWGWDVTTGANVNNPAVRIGCYPVSVREGALFVQVAP